MSIDYTEEARLALLEGGSSNWGAVMAGVLEQLDKGLELTFVFGDTVVGEEVMYLSPLDGKVYKSVSDDLTKLPPIGFAPNAVTAGQTGKIRWFGWIDVDTSYSYGADMSFDYGECVYVDSVAGRVTKIRPQNASLVGFVKIAQDASYNSRILIAPSLCLPKITQMWNFVIDDLGQSVSIDDLECFVSPTAVELISIGILSQGVPAGIDAGNQFVITIKDAADNTIVTKIYGATAFPSNAYDDLSGLDATHKILTPAEIVRIDVDSSGTADPPTFLVVFEYKLRY